MKKYILFATFLLIMVFVSACGTQASTVTEVPTQPAASEAPSQASSSGNSTQVTVTLKDNTIDASQTDFKVGVPYTFIITNEGRHAHNFNINPPVSVAGSLDGALASALLAVPQEKLAVGSSVTVEYTFPDSAAGQLLEFSCLIKRHYEDGMLVPITVTK
jgi:uncharacterized cupredoxin-like copper-binding protein